MNLQQKLIATALSVAMLFSVTTQASVSATDETVVNNKKSEVAEKSEAKVTVNESTVSRVEKSASQPSKAGKLINEIEDTATYEEALRTALDEYYSNGNSENAEELDRVVDSRGDEIFENYSNAQDEREKEPEELGFVPGEVLAVTKENIKDEEIPEIIDDERMSVTAVLPYAEDRKLIKISISLEDTVDNAIEKLESNENIEYIEKDQVYTNDYILSDYIDDTDYEELYHLNLVKSVETWQLLGKTEHEKIKVAVIDTGIDIGHEDLKNVINKDLSVRITADGIICPLKGDNGTHGTHVSGIIAAEANNEVGISGVGSAIDNSVIDLIGIGCDMGDGSTFTTISVYRAIKYAVENGARVINMSLGGKGDSNNIFQNAVTLAVNSGCVVVCASGNDGSNEYYYPSDCEGAVSVIALDQTGENRASFSNYGASNNKISAPGCPVYSTIPDNNYENYAGTSMASPVIAAVAAMILAVNPQLTASEVKDIIYNSADDINGGGYDDELGYGRVNAYEAVKKAIEYDSVKFPRSLQLSKSKLELGKGATAKLNSTILPSYAIQTISYHSKNDGIATVSSDGTVTAKSTGTTEIVACTANNIISKCIVTVKDSSKSKLSAPEADTVQTGISTGATINWKKVDNAEYYQIYACDTEDGDYSYIGSTYNTVYSIDMLHLYAKPASTVYFLKVRAITSDNSISDSEFSDTIAYIYIGQAPYLTIDLIDDEGYGKGLFAHWGAIVSSELYRTSSEDNKPVLLETFHEGVNDDNCYYDNTGELKEGVTYTYTLKLFNTYKGVKYYGIEDKVTLVYQEDDPVIENCGEPNINGIKYKNSRISISLLTNSDHILGRIYCSSDNGKTWFTACNFIDANNTYTSWDIDLEPKPETTYMFRYKYYETGKMFGLYRNCSKYSNVVSITTPKASETPQLYINKGSNNEAILSWNSTDFNDGYFTLYRRSDGVASWDTLADNIKDYKYTDTTVEDNSVYYYKVVYTNPTPDVKFEADDYVITSALNQKSDDSNIVSHRTATVIKDICTADFSKINDVVYNESTELPPFTVTYRGTKLRENVDYVAFSDDIYVGKATITVTGIGEYTGQKVLSYNIVQPEDYKNSLCTVTYVDYDGTVLSTEKVEKNSYALPPANPKRSGYIFMGWSNDGYNITTDTTITAIYQKSEEKLYTVTFVDRENNVLSSQKIEYGGTAKAPEAPIIDGYTFVEWYGNYKSITNNTVVKAKYKAIKFERGTGTESNPYIIATAEQLDYFSYVINYQNSQYNTAYYKLANDIYYNDITNCSEWGKNSITGDMYCPENIWEPAGIELNNNTQNSFKGTFDGNGYSIFGLFVLDTKDYAGFIGNAENAVIRNLGIENSYIQTKGNYAGALVGMFSSTNTKTEIYCCFTRDNIIISGGYAGGLAGQIITITPNSTINITNCYSSDSYVEITTDDYLGGFSGLIKTNGTSTILKYCYTNNSIYTTLSECSCGGFSGDILKSTSGNISVDCSYYLKTYDYYSYFGEDPYYGSPINTVNITGVLEENFKDRNYFSRLIEYTTNDGIISDANAVWVFSNDDIPRLYTENGRYTAKFYLNNDLFYLVALKEGEKLNVPFANPDYGYYATGWSGKIPETMPAYNLTFFNVVKENEYTVEFYLNNDLLVTTTLHEGNEIFTPSFAGDKTVLWAGLPTKMPDQNIKVYGYYDDQQLGDVNYDGEISIKDTIMVMKYTVNSKTLNSAQLLFADVNSSGNVDVIDAILIQKYIVGMITSF